MSVIKISKCSKTGISNNLLTHTHYPQSMCDCSCFLMLLVLNLYCVVQLNCANEFQNFLYAALLLQTLSTKIKLSIPY